MTIWEGMILQAADKMGHDEGRGAAVLDALAQLTG